MKQTENNRRLIDGTICVVAQYGMEKTTIKQICAQSDLHESHIYRHFGGKKQLLSNVFLSLDLELENLLVKSLPIMEFQALPMQERYWLLFQRVWHFLLGNRDKCLCYVQYYYSPYFEDLSGKEHKRIFQPVAMKISSAFWDDVDVWMLLGNILKVMLNFAVKVHNGSMPDNESTSLQVFNAIYATVGTYFKYE